MKFQIPFTFSELEKLKKKSKFLINFIKYRKKSWLSESLMKSGANITREEYMAITIRSFFIIFISLLIASTFALFLFNTKNFILLGLGISVIFSLFAFLSQQMYPKMYVSKKQLDIEKNLIPALEDMLVQLNSGIPLFSILVNLSSSNYGELSNEFKKAVKRIGSGEPEISVFDDLGNKNPSFFFRRFLWQLSNGMRAGSDMAIVIKDSLKSLNEEQLIQIQNYGNKLNPLIVFYMLISVIIPALSITFLTIISSMINLQKDISIIVFMGLFAGVVFIQIMFLGVIRSQRPNLI